MPRERFTVICIPGRDEDNYGAWFVVDNNLPPEHPERSVACKNRADAIRFARLQNTGTNYDSLSLAGRCRSGGDQSGHVFHAVPPGEWKALCGKSPGRSSAGWSQNVGTVVTCPRCLRRLAQASEAKGE